MTLIQSFYNLIKKGRLNVAMVIKTNRNKIFDNRRVTLLSLIIVFGIIFYFLTNASSNKIRENKDNLAVVTNSKDFSYLAQYFISKIQSPYVDVKYLIKNIFTILKMLKILHS